MRGYCGDAGGGLTAAYLVGLDPELDPVPLWDLQPHVPPAALESLWAKGWDISRAMWDTRDLIFLLDLDYQNIDQPAEPYLRPAEVFVKVEPVYRAVARLLGRHGLHARPS